MAKIFISHSSHDKRLVVQTLVDELHRHEHDVWYDSESLQLGDSVALGISDGLSKSQYYLIVISTHFLSSNWCMRELGAIVTESIEHARKLLIIRIDDVQVPSVISDILRLEISSGAPDQIRSALDRIILYLNGEEPPGHSERRESRPSDVVAGLFETDRQKRYGTDLLPRPTIADLNGPENEGVILIKPGGTFFEPCLREIFRRISGTCRLHQVRLLDGSLVRKRGLFDTQYVTSTRIARGEVKLNHDDFQRIREIYDMPEFEAEYGAPYSDDLVTPALTLCDQPHNLDPVQISALWEKGRHGGLFHNHKWDGLNKIGYQKSVFPIPLPLPEKPTVRIVLNGFIPGYRQLFVNPAARVVAIHVSSQKRWQVIRDSIVGGDSDPYACAKGSIRRDAAEGIIPLAPDDCLVNGQRNVCHSSATLFDGMRELMAWFEYAPEQTLLGQLLLLNEIRAEQIEELTQSTLPDISWWTRNETVGQLLFEVGVRVARDEIHGANSTRRERMVRYANSVPLRAEQLSQHDGFRRWIENGVRLTVGKEDLYFRSIARLFDDARSRAVFYEVAKTVKSIASRHSDGTEPEVLAEAYRIAAGDIALLRCPAYGSCLDSPELFQSLVLGELPEEALSCAIRTRKNLLDEYRAVFSSNVVPATTGPIGQSLAWTEFLQGDLKRETTDKPIVALVLCGGRSTRMGSTIPKPVLPLRRSLLLNSVHDMLARATNQESETFAAVGFRSGLVRRAIGGRVRYLEFAKTLGLAFRVATCLETLSSHEGLVILAYTDMPLVSYRAVQRLLEQVNDDRTFGLITSHAEHLSGHVVEQNGKILGVIQKRLDPDKVSPRMQKDVGVYVFYNTPEFRDAVKRITDENIRGEYIFADIVKILAEEGWAIVSSEEHPDHALGINTAGELLSVACAAYRTGVGEAELGEMFSTLSTDYRLLKLNLRDIFSLREALRTYTGPLHYFQWWDEHWARALA